MLPYSPLFCSTLYTNVASVLQRNAWFDSGYYLRQSTELFVSHIFHAKVTSDPEVAAGLLVTMLALPSSSLSSGPSSSAFGRYGQEGQFSGRARR